jgi:hypothetical protein
MSSHRTGRLSAVLFGATLAGAALAGFLGAAGAAPRAKDVELTVLTSTSNRGEIEPCG